MQDIQSVPSSNPRRFSFDILASWMLLGTITFASILIIPNTSVPFVFTKVSVLAIGILMTLIAYILARLTRGNIIVPPAKLIIVFWLVPCAYVLSAIFSGEGIIRSFFGNSFENDTLGFMSICALSGTLTALIFRRTTQYKTFFRTVSIVYMIVVVAQVVFLLLGQLPAKSISPVTNLIGTFADVGMFAGLGVVLSLLAYRFLSLSSLASKFLMGAGALALLSIAVVNSTLVWSLLALTSLGLFIESILRQKPSTTDDIDDVHSFEMSEESSFESNISERKGLGAPLLVLVCSIFFLIGGNTIGSSLTNSFGANYLDVRPSWKSTFAIGSHTYGATPFFGSGPNTFNQEWLKFHDKSLNDTIFWNVDFISGIGSIPTSFITTGIIGGIAWIIFLSLFLFVGIRSLIFRSPEDASARFTAIASFVGALYVFLLGIFSVPSPILVALGFMFAGLFISTLRYGGIRKEWGIVFAKNPRIGFVIVFLITIFLLVSIFGIYAVAQRYVGVRALTKAQQSLQNGNTEEAQSQALKATVFAPSDKAYQIIAAAGIATMNTVANDNKLSKVEAQRAFQAALSGSIQATQMAIKENASNYENYILLGNVYQTVVPLQIEGAYTNAKQAYENALLQNPSNPTILYALAQLEIAQKNGKGAEEYLIKAINLKHDYTQAIFLLSQLEVQLGKAKEALQAAEAAAYFAPNDPGVLFQVGILRSGTGDTDGAITVLLQAVEKNPQYANARFFLGVSYANKGLFDKAIEQLRAIGELSSENALAVAPYIAVLQSGKNPFPKPGTLLQPPVTDVPASNTPAGTKGKNIGV
jgi:tetratricopeptide (TPR) repeat protein